MGERTTSCRCSRSRLRKRRLCEMADAMRSRASLLREQPECQPHTLTHTSSFACLPFGDDHTVNVLSRRLHGLCADRAAAPAVELDARVVHGQPLARGRQRVRLRRPPVLWRGHWRRLAWLASASVPARVLAALGHAAVLGPSAGAVGTSAGAVGTSARLVRTSTTFACAPSSRRCCSVRNASATSTSGRAGRCVSRYVSVSCQTTATLDPTHAPPLIHACACACTVP
jgi:hypothetical protein